MKKTLVLLCAVGSLGPLASFAQDAPPSAGTIKELADLNNQIAILNKKLIIAQLNHQISQNGGADDPSPPALGNPAPQAADHTLPLIVSIFGEGSHLSATLQMQSGAQLIVTSGEPISNGLTVLAVTATGVSVLRGSAVIPLGFIGSDAGVADNTPGSTPQNAIPFPPVSIQAPPRLLPPSSGANPQQSQ